MNKLIFNPKIAAIAAFAVLNGCGSPYQLAISGDSLASVGQKDSTRGSGDTGNGQGGGPGADAGDFNCQHFVEISQFPAVIPARGADGTCYYKKLFNSIPLSGSTGTRKTNVLSRNHDSGQNPPTINPYILGDTSFSFQLAGARGVTLSGSNTKLSPILVDNYLLFGVASGGGAMAYSAFGTSDSTIPGTDHILVNQQPVVVNSDGFTGGTATVQALSLTRTLPVNTDIQFALSALDCGGARQLSDVYIVFQ